MARLTRPEPSTRPQQMTVGLAVTLEEDQGMASEEREWTLGGKKHRRPLSSHLDDPTSINILHSIFIPEGSVIAELRALKMATLISGNRICPSHS